MLLSARAIVHPLKSMLDLRLLEEEMQENGAFA